MILQQMCNFKNENVSQNPTVLHPLKIESANMVENIPVQRPKRKIQHKKSSDIISTGIENNVI